MMSRQEARKILGDDPHKTFRALSKIHHPDAGGNVDDFNRIRDAYESLTKEEPTAEHDLLGQLFLQELDADKVFVLLDTMEAKFYETINAIPARALKLKQARPKARGFLMTVLEYAISNLEEEKRTAKNGIAEVKRARDLLKDLYTK